RESLRILVANASAQTSLDVVVDHLREAAKLSSNGLGLLNEHVEHMILGALRQDEIVAPDFVRGLELAVNSTVPLFDTTRIPRQIEMEQVRAMRLEIEPLSSRVGGQQDAERVLRGIGIEALLDLLAQRASGETVDDRDALVGAIRGFDCLLENRFQI